MKPLELSHDIIAKKVWERLPEIDKQLQGVKKSLQQRQKDWSAGKGSFLGPKELAAWEKPIERLRDSLDPAVLEYIEKSQVDVEHKARERAQQLKKEAQRKRTRIFLVVTAIGFMIALGLAYWAYSESVRANTHMEQAHAERARAEIARQEAEKASRIAQEQRAIAVKNQEQAELERRRAQEERDKVASALKDAEAARAEAERALEEAEKAEADKVIIKENAEKEMAEVQQGIAEAKKALASFEDELPFGLSSVFAQFDSEQQKADPLSRQIQTLQEEIVPALEDKQIMYNADPGTLSDASGILHQVLQVMAERYPDIQRPTVEEARDSRSIARWYYDRDNLIIIKSTEDALERADLIQAGAILFFGRSGQTYRDPTIDELTARSGISTVGIVVDVQNDDAGKIMSYALFQGRSPGKPASTTHYHARIPQRPNLPPFGNWSSQWLAVAYPLEGQKGQTK